MPELSSNLLLVAFFLYLLSTILFAVAVTGKKFRNRQGHFQNRSGFLGYVASIIGFLFAMGYFITRWIAAGHAPVSNMFEYTAFLAIMMSFALVIIYTIYKSDILGLFTMPVVMLIIVYASMFPTEIQPLIPALQSYWLEIHVITTAIGQGILAISFAAGLIYLVRVIDFTKRNKRVRGVEFILYTILCFVAYISLSIGFNVAGYEAEFQYINENGQEAMMEYPMPAVVGPNEGQLLTDQAMEPFLSAPSIIESNDLNTVVWSMVSGLLLYWLIRLAIRKPIGAVLQPLTKSISPQAADELSYRAIAIGFPIFTLGGLIFAMIWAQIAWTRFWAWDPKEVWALITFLFYAAYLHLRLSRGWHGERSAWLCVIGFAIIMFNLIFVNLIIAGLHSYA
ncbi:c-type cytochrome biogenesis protein CcsB [Texcoconibacillus texcoconensis]|uniref:Cytochrome c-type biogenesis protein CcsB n=1 Tax=Texcoconibacillus texcoconensis TaxID=1095777 RepID=A0A840QNJ8_9BACI|nr:c-type cytochrome biogenesis protein CcsB [Texcoconibacillus texcoconensis]MBB5172949.1 cytochrome c-type biogenesis protein CcsB [Texcoconibacillus texcoconensis]